MTKKFTRKELDDWWWNGAIFPTLVTIIAMGLMIFAFLKMGYYIYSFILFLAVLALIHDMIWGD